MRGERGGEKGRERTGNQGYQGKRNGKGGEKWGKGEKKES